MRSPRQSRHHEPRRHDVVEDHQGHDGDHLREAIVKAEPCEAENDDHCGCNVEPGQGEISNDSTGLATTFRGWEDPETGQTVVHNAAERVCGDNRNGERHTKATVEQDKASEVEDEPRPAGDQELRRSADFVMSNELLDGGARRKQSRSEALGVGLGHVYQCDSLEPLAAVLASRRRAVLAPSMLTHRAHWIRGMRCTRV